MSVSLDGLVKTRQRSNAKVLEVRALSGSRPRKEDIDALAKVGEHLERLLARLSIVPGESEAADGFRQRFQHGLTLTGDMDRAIAVLTVLRDEVAVHLAKAQGTVLTSDSPEKDKLLRALEFKARFEHTAPYIAEWVARMKETPWLDSKLKTAKKAREATAACERFDTEARGAGKRQAWEEGYKAFLKADAEIGRYKAAVKAHEALVEKQAAKKGDRDPFAVAGTIRKALAEAQRLSVPEVLDFRSEVDTQLGVARRGDDTSLANAWTALVQLDSRVKIAIRGADTVWRGLDERWDALKAKVDGVWAVEGLGAGSLGEPVSAWKGARDRRDKAEAREALERLDGLLKAPPLSEVVDAHDRWQDVQKGGQSLLDGYVALEADGGAGYLGPIVVAGSSFHDRVGALRRALALDGVGYADAIAVVKAAGPPYEEYAELRRMWMALADSRELNASNFALALDDAKKFVDRARKGLKAVASNKSTMVAGLMEQLIAVWDLPKDLAAVERDWGIAHLRAGSVPEIGQALTDAKKRLAEVSERARKVDTAALYDALNEQVARDALRVRLVQLRTDASFLRTDLDRSLKDVPAEDPLLDKRSLALASVGLQSVELSSLLAGVGTDAVSDLERRTGEVASALEKLTGEVRVLVQDPTVALTSEQLEQSDRLRQTLRPALEKLQNDYRELDAVRKKRKAKLGSGRANKAALKEWIASRLDELGLLLSRLGGTDDPANLTRIQERVTALQKEVRGGRSRIEALDPPEESTLGTRIDAMLKALAADNVIGRHRKVACGELTEAMTKVRVQIGRKPSFVLEGEYEPLRERARALFADARNDVALLEEFETEKKAWKVTVAVSTWATLEERYPNVAAGYTARYEGAKARTGREGKIADALEDLRKLHLEVKITLGDFVKQGPTLELAEAQARDAAVKKEEARAAFTGLQRELRGMYETLKRAYPTNTALDTAIGYLDQAKQAGKAESWETGISMLKSAKERLDYIRKNPRGPAAIGIEELPGAVRVWQEAANAYVTSLTGLLKELVDAGCSDSMRYALEAEVSELRDRIPVRAFDDDVRTVCEVTERKARLAARERALAILRDTQSHLFSDTRVRLLRGAPVTTDIPLEPMGRALADLERLLLMAIPMN